MRREQKRQRAGEAHLLGKPAQRGVARRLARSRVAAAGVGTQPAGMILAGGALLQQQAVVVVAYDHRNGAVAQALTVRLELAHGAERPVIGIDENHLVGRVLRAPHYVIFTYSKSPGLLSMP